MDVLRSLRKTRWSVSLDLKIEPSWLREASISSKRWQKDCKMTSDAVAVKGGWHSVSQLGICLGSQPGDLPLCLSQQGKWAVRARQAGGLGICTPIARQLGSQCRWKGTECKAELSDQRPDRWNQNPQVYLPHSVVPSRSVPATQRLRASSGNWKHTENWHGRAKTQMWLQRAIFPLPCTTSPTLNSGGLHPASEGEDRWNFEMELSDMKLFEWGLDRFL